MIMVHSLSRLLTVMTIAGLVLTSLVLCASAMNIPSLTLKTSPASLPRLARLPSNTKPRLQGLHYPHSLRCTEPKSVPWRNIESGTLVKNFLGEEETSCARERQGSEEDAKDSAFPRNDPQASNNLCRERAEQILNKLNALTEVFKQECPLDRLGSSRKQLVEEVESELSCMQEVLDAFLKRQQRWIFNDHQGKVMGSFC
jgi:hypothetical protein